MTSLPTTSRRDVPEPEPPSPRLEPPERRVGGGGVVISEPPVPAVQRSRADVVRLVAASLALLVGVFIARFLPQPLVSTERAVLDLSRQLPGTIEQIVVIVIQVAAVYLPLAFLVSHLVRRQLRRLGVAVVSALTSALLMRLLLVVLDTPRATAQLTDLGRQVVRSSAGFPSPVYLAAATAVVVVELPWLGRRWRHATGLVIIALCFARMASGNSLPRDLIAALASGWVVGCAALLVFGSNNRRPRGADVATALARAGTPVRSVTWSDFPVQAAQAYECTTRDGRPIFVKVRSHDDRATDVLVRLYRRLRLRDEQDEPPRVSLQHMVEHEALVASRARDEGVPVPRLVAVAGVGVDGVLIAFERLPAVRFSDATDELDDDAIEHMWAVVRQLHDARIAHGRLTLHNFVRTDDGAIALVDFASGMLAPPDTLLAGDIAELLCDTAVHVGPERAVRLAVAGIGADAVATALPRLQPLALTRPTRQELSARPGLLDELRDEARDATGAPVVELAELERVKPRTIVLVAGSAAAFYILLPQLTDISGIWNELRSASPAWVLAGLIAAAVTFVGAAVALRGSLVDRPPFVPTAEAQLASSFANFATPAQVGGIAVNLRFLQKQGTESAVAAAAVGLDTVAGLAVHLALLGAFLFAAGNQPAGELVFPWDKIAIAVAAVAAVALLTLAVPQTRHLVATCVVPLFRRSAAGIAAVGKRPSRIAGLLGGSLLVTVAYAAALAASVAAIGGEVNLIDIMVVYLIGSAIATAAPTPGGLGAVEAAMVAGLVSVGLPSATAFSAVLVYRGVTFWAPLLPGWLSFTSLQRRGAL